MIDVAIVDDHELVRHGFVQLINLQARMRVVYDCDTVEQMTEWLADHAVDIVVTDLTLRESSGLQVLDAVASKAGSSAIVLSMHDHEPHISLALAKGAKAFIPKATKPQTLIDAITAVHQGDIFLPQSIQLQLQENHNSQQQIAFKQLTERERQVFEGIAAGLEIKRIAARLDISIKTVHVHKANLMHKLQVNSNFDLTKLALKLGLLSAQALYQQDL